MAIPFPSFKRSEDSILTNVNNQLEEGSNFILSGTITLGSSSAGTLELDSKVVSTYIDIVELKILGSSTLFSINIFEDPSLSSDSSIFEMTNVSTNSRVLLPCSMLHVNNSGLKKIYVQIENLQGGSSDFEVILRCNK